MHLIKGGQVNGNTLNGNGIILGTHTHTDETHWAKKVLGNLLKYTFPADLSACKVGIGISHLTASLQYSIWSHINKNLLWTVLEWETSYFFLQICQIPGTNKKFNFKVHLLINRSIVPTNKTSTLLNLSNSFHEKPTKFRTPSVIFALKLWKHN